MKSDTLKNRKGQALVETALVLFVIVIITFAITEFGRAMYIKNMLNNAARSGVRQAVVTGTLTLPVSYNAGAFIDPGPNPSTDPVGAKIHDGLMYVEKSKVSATVAGVDSSGNPITTATAGNTITVTVTLNDFKPFVNIIKISSTLVGQASMRYE